MDQNKVFQNSQVNDTATITEKAGTAIDDVRGRLVKYNASGDVVLCEAGDAPIGVAIVTNSATHVQGEFVDVQIRYNGLVMAGAAIAKGDALASDANGKAVKATAGAATIGIALESAKGADSIIRFALARGAAATAAP